MTWPYILLISGKIIFIYMMFWAQINYIYTWTKYRGVVRILEKTQWENFIQEKTLYVLDINKKRGCIKDMYEVGIFVYLLT